MDHLHLDAPLGKIALGQRRILGGDADPRPLGWVVALPEVARLGHDQPAEAEAQVHRLVHVWLLLGEDVLAHDAEVGGAVLHIRRDVRGLEEDESQVALHVGEEESARVGFEALDAHAREQLERRVEQPALGQRDGQRWHARSAASRCGHPATGASSPVLRNPDRGDRHVRSPSCHVRRARPARDTPRRAGRWP